MGTQFQDTPTLLRMKAAKGHFIEHCILEGEWFRFRRTGRKSGGRHRGMVHTLKLTTEINEGTTPVSGWFYVTSYAPFHNSVRVQFRAAELIISLNWGDEGCSLNTAISIINCSGKVILAAVRSSRCSPPRGGECRPFGTTESISPVCYFKYPIALLFQTPNCRGGRPRRPEVLTSRLSAS